VPIFDDNGVRSHAICKRCGKKFAARASIGTGSLNKHMLACRKKLASDRKVQSKLAMNVDGLHNWVYDASRTRNELCQLIARLDLPLGVGDTQAWEDYIKRLLIILDSKRFLSRLLLETCISCLLISVLCLCIL
jgi:hypothetical protein